MVRVCVLVMPVPDSSNYCTHIQEAEREGWRWAENEGQAPPVLNLNMKDGSMSHQKWI